ncbi:MAG: ABC transporter permease [Defluviitaleaceae bacterium]|nr:ABC transporter permease [Defluviitaleaceae bacterium]
MKNLDLIKKAVPLLGLVLLIILFALTTDGRFLRAINLMNILSQSAIILVAGIGCIFVMSHNNLDFSLGGACALSAVIAFIIASNTSFALLLPICIAVGMLCGFITATLHIKARIPAFLAGLAIMFVGRGLARGTDQQFRMILPSSFIPLQNVYFYMTVVAVLFVAGYILFEYTKIGKYNKLIGSNEEVAKLSGIPVNRYKTLAFLVSGFTVGVAAFLSIIRGGGVSAATGLNLEINVLIALTLGGLPLTGGSQSKLRAIIIGGLALTIINNGLVLWGVASSVIDIIRGIVFLSVVVVSIDRTSGKIMV